MKAFSVASEEVVCDGEPGAMSKDCQDVFDQLCSVWLVRYGDNSIVSIHFLLSETLENTMVVDQHSDHLRQLFDFDYGSCCGDQSPDEDETVLHFRSL